MSVAGFAISTIEPSLSR